MLDCVIHGQMGNVLVNHVSYNVSCTGNLGHVWVNHTMCHIGHPWVIWVMCESYWSCMGHIMGHCGSSLSQPYHLLSPGSYMVIWVMYWSTMCHIWVIYGSFLGHLWVSHTIGYTVPVCYPQGPLSSWLINICPI